MRYPKIGLEVNFGGVEGEGRGGVGVFWHGVNGGGKSLVGFFYPKEHTLKILCWYLNWKCVRKGEVKKGGTWRTLGGFLTGDMEDRVILDIMDDIGGPQGTYPESFLSLSLFLAEI